MTLRVFATLALFGLVLSACAPVRPKVLENPAFAQAYQARLEQLQALDHWALNGRLAISDGKNGGSGNLSWLSSTDLNQLSFRGALGKGAWQLRADENGARLELANGTVHYAQSVSELALEQIGWKVPVDALSWWVRGLAQPGAWESRQLDAQGRLEKLRQFGWDVEFVRYAEPDSFWLPTKLIARRGDYSVKMAIRDWRLDVQSVEIE